MTKIKNNWLMLQRARAFGLHFLASLTVVGAALVAMAWAWYPRPLGSLQGWFGLLGVIAAVDITLGPLLTFVIYVPGKKHLRFDLAVIVLLQVAALLYGIYTSATGRPVYLVFLKDRFEVVAAPDYPVEEINAAKDSPFVHFPWLGPQPVTAMMPQDRNEQSRIMMSAALSVGAGGLRIMPRYYQPYATATKTAIEKGKKLSSIQAANPAQGKLVADWIQSENRDAGQVVFVPLKCRLGYGLVMLDEKSGEIISMKAIDPSWY